MVIYHGSNHIITEPEFGLGKKNNDYGQGFYCTESKELALEWAVDMARDGYANVYEFDCSDLNIMNLSDEKYSVLNWIAILLENREFQINSLIGLEAKNYLHDFFLPDYEKYDVICGYRADDSYFAFAKAFINNTLSISQLSAIMHLGNLGEQITLKSPRAYKNIRFVEAIEAESSIWYPCKQFRDEAARKAYRDYSKTSYNIEDIYMMDILRGRLKNEDIRI